MKFAKIGNWKRSPMLATTKHRALEMLRKAYCRMCGEWVDDVDMRYDEQRGNEFCKWCAEVT